ncbi:DUF7333 family protein [Halorussus pelagicus]|uniref:DUF7333 family protein n=1 Tax=Halorussus pelagicus TaxID=2505977 RepID=UPI000FFCA1C3|nr:hypothetical protein [Halorussus pelagicus]
MEFNLPVTAAALLAIVGVGTAALIGMGFMATNTVLMMVTPSMLAFGLVALFLGIKHGEYRATR